MDCEATTHSDIKPATQQKQQGTKIKHAALQRQVITNAHMQISTHKHGNAVP